MTESAHLMDIMEKHQRTCNMQVVFLDIEKYSQRRTVSQIEVVDRFTANLSGALAAISKTYVEYAQANNLNFQNDIITLPTGDGAAVIFSFDGLHDIHLAFAKTVLQLMHEQNESDRCEKFIQVGWCNCHDHFNLRIGISEGKGIVFKDVNQCFNVAGGVVNMAARVMGLGDRNHIIFTSEAFSQIVDMVDDPNMVDFFVPFENIEIKHAHKITVHQYIDRSCPHINSCPPENLVLRQRMMNIGAKMKKATSFIPDVDFEPSDRNALVDMMEKVTNAMIEMSEREQPPTIDIPASLPPEPPEQGASGEPS